MHQPLCTGQRKLAGSLFRCCFRGRLEAPQWRTDPRLLVHPQLMMLLLLDKLSEVSQPGGSLPEK